MLPEERSESMVCDGYDWLPRRLPWFVWRDLFWRLPRKFRFRPAQDNPDTELAQMLRNVRDDIHAEGSDDSSLLQRLEAQIAIMNDAEVRKLLARYLCEP